MSAGSHLRWQADLFAPARHRVEAAANALGGPDDAEARTELAAALAQLSTTLLEHLDFEESVLEPTILGLTAWPF